MWPLPSNNDLLASLNDPTRVTGVVGLTPGTESLSTPRGAVEAFAYHVLQLGLDVPLGTPVVTGNEAVVPLLRTGAAPLEVRVVQPVPAGPWLVTGTSQEGLSFAATPDTVALGDVLTGTAPAGAKAVLVTVTQRDRTSGARVNVGDGVWKFQLSNGERAADDETGALWVARVKAGAVSLIVTTVPDEDLPVQVAARSFTAS